MPFFAFGRFSKIKFREGAAKTTNFSPIPGMYRFPTLVSIKQFSGQKTLPTGFIHTQQ